MRWSLVRGTGFLDLRTERKAEQEPGRILRAVRSTGCSFALLGRERTLLCGTPNLSSDNLSLIWPGNVDSMVRGMRDANRTEGSGYRNRSVEMASERI
jgi:hypothetical protein